MDLSEFNNRHEQSDPEENKPASMLRMIYGIFMVIVYVGMGILLLINFFGWDTDWAWTRYIVGVVLIIYGFWRGYRQYAGID
jgi:cytochrome c biogenesis protein CcdA